MKSGSFGLEPRFPQSRKKDAGKQFFPMRESRSFNSYQAVKLLYKALYEAAIYPTINIGIGKIEWTLKNYAIILRTAHCSTDCQRQPQIGPSVCLYDSFGPAGGHSPTTLTALYS